MLSACGGNLHPPRASGGGTSSVFSLSTEQQQRPILKHLQYHSNCTVIYILERRTDKTLTKLIIYNGDFARTAQNFEEKFIVFFHFFSRCLLFWRWNIFRTCGGSNYYCFGQSSCFSLCLFLLVFVLKNLWCQNICNYLLSKKKASSP